MNKVVPSTFDAAPRAGLAPRQRWLSAAEALAAFAIIAAHNVWHVIPNEVPILFVLAILSCRLREGRWGLFLYGRPRAWIWTLLAALLCFGLLQVKDAVLEPLARLFWAEPAGVSSVLTRSRDPATAAATVLFVWLFAALGEEVGYRGYLLRRAAEALGPSRGGIAAALIFGAAAAAFGHFYKGAAGMLDSAGSALILGGAFLASRRLWIASLAHGLNDTVAVVLTYLGTGG